MAKQRYIDTHFWDDGFIESIKPLERYLFMYFLTNPHTNICGVYELSIKKIVDETDLTQERVIETMKKFEEAGKIYYFEGWVFVKNFIRHQAINPNIRLGIANKARELPKKILDRIAYIAPSHSLLIGTELPEPKPKLELKPKGFAEDGFEIFWKEYPNKTSKKKAFQVWNKIAPDQELLEKILSALATQKKSSQWLKDGGQFIPHPTTWLNQERWNDEKVSIAPPKSTCKACNKPLTSSVQGNDGLYCDFDCLYSKKTIKV